MAKKEEKKDVESKEKEEKKGAESKKDKKAADVQQAESQPPLPPQEIGSQPPLPQPGAPAAPAGARAPAAGIVPEGFTINEAGAHTIRSDYFAGSFAITEGLLAFGRVSRDSNREIKIESKVIVSIRDAKRILLTLQRLVKQYEDKYGDIRV